MRRHRSQPQPKASPGELVARAHRLRRRGEERKALLTLRAACFEEDASPRLWGLYGYQALRVGKEREAEEALSRAIWLFERQHDSKRAQAVRRLLRRIDPHAVAA